MFMIAICEDDSFTRNDLKRRVKKYLTESAMYAQISCFNMGVQLVRSNEYFDVIIMDIKMTGMDGMETIRLLRSKGKCSQVVFVTATKEYVFQAFDVEAVHYLVKPVSDEELFHSLDKAVKRSVYVDTQTISITKGSSVQIVRIRDILYCESVDHKIYIYTYRGRFDYYGKLGSLQEQLDSRFFRCHRSYIVNMNYVAGKEQDLAIMVNGEKILVSRRKRQEFTQQLLTYIRSEVL